MNKPTSTPLTTAIASSWALLLGFGILMLGDGLQGTLLAVRAYREGFPTAVTGLVMSSFYAGFLGGTLWAPGIVRRVGHIRVFAALAALASAGILVHAAFVHPVAWVALRLLSGFCFSGLYIVAESWLNDSASNQTRGQLLSVYMVITYLAVGGGQLFLNLADPVGYPLFVLTSVLISVAVVPLLLSATPAPRFEESNSVKLSDLYRISPLGVFGMFAVGLVTAAIFSLGPVYAGLLGLDTAGISYFMLAPVVATVLLQWPIGRLSDRFDRRLVILVVTVIASAAAVMCIYAGRISTPPCYRHVCPVRRVFTAHVRAVRGPHQRSFKPGADGGGQQRAGACRRHRRGHRATRNRTGDGYFHGLVFRGAGNRACRYRGVCAAPHADTRSQTAGAAGLSRAGHVTTLAPHGGIDPGTPSG